MDSFSDVEEDRALAEMLDSESYQNMESQSQVEDDYAFAQMLETQYASEDAHTEVASFIPPQFINGSPSNKKQHKPHVPGNSDKSKGLSIIAPEWEDLDPTPDLHALFLQYNERFFWGKLSGCEVKWSPRMTLCAGVCSYQGRGGLCSIRLSLPLLKLRPRKDLVETLLHEMIHAYLFVTDGNDNHDGHGPAFHEHMFRINKETGTKISVYHNFQAEVALYKQHWWKCNGPCVNRKPFYGLVKRSMNRAPGPTDPWWKQHQTTCGGTYIKFKEPEGYGKTQKNDKSKGQRDIRSFGKTNGQNNGSTVSGGIGSDSSNNVLGKGEGTGNIFGFGGSSFKPPAGVGLQSKGRAGAHVLNPGWKAKDNSSGGQIVRVGNLSKTNESENTHKHTNLNNTNDSKRTDFTAVGKVNLDDTSDKVRQNVRDFWSTKPNDASNSKPSSSTQQKINISQEITANTNDIPVVKSEFDRAECKDVEILSESSSSKTSKCPVCNKHVIESKINSHLDECLDVIVSEKDGNLSKLGTKRKSTSNNPFIEEGKRPILTIDDGLNIDENVSSKCPICNRDVLDAEMQCHINYCLDK